MECSVRPIHERGRFFVSLPASFPATWAVLINSYATDMGIAAFVYHGIPHPPKNLTSNAEHDARGDMFSAQYVFAALSLCNGVPVDGVWVIKYASILVKEGIGFNLALVGTISREALENTRSWLCIPDDIKISVFPSAEDWLEFLKDQMRVWISCQFTKPT